MAFWDDFLSSGIEGAAKGIGSLAKDLRAAITGKEAIPAETAVELQRIAALLEEGENKVEAATIESVNATMREEAKSEHWAQWLWRPFNGFIFGVTFFGNYFVLPLLKIQGPSIPPEAWLMMGAILGVASWHRGAAKVEEVRKR